MLEMESILRCMKLSKIFQHIQGLVITDTLPRPGNESIKLINEISADYNYPVCSGWPSGIYPMILGSNVVLSVNENGTELYLV